MFKLKRLKWSNLWRHYSSYALYAVIAVGGLEIYLPQLADKIPVWAFIAIALAGALVKVLPQDKK